MNKQNKRTRNTDERNGKEKEATEKVVLIFYTPILTLCTVHLSYRTMETISECQAFVSHFAVSGRYGYERLEWQGALYYHVHDQHQ